MELNRAGQNSNIALSLPANKAYQKGCLRDRGGTFSFGFIEVRGFGHPHDHAVAIFVWSYNLANRVRSGDDRACGICAFQRLCYLRAAEKSLVAVLASIAARRSLPAKWFFPPGHAVFVEAASHGELHF